MECVAEEPEAWAEFFRTDGTEIKLGDEVFFEDELTKLLTSGRVVGIQPLIGAGPEGEDICMIEIDYGGPWAGHTHFIQATDVITKTEMASRDTKRKPRAPPTRYSDYMSASGAGAGCMKDDGDKELDGKIKMEGFSQKAATARKSQYQRRAGSDTSSIDDYYPPTSSGRRSGQLGNKRCRRADSSSHVKKMDRKVGASKKRRACGEEGDIDNSEEGSDEDEDSEESEDERREVISISSSTSSSSYPGLELDEAGEDDPRALARHSHSRSSMTAGKAGIAKNPQRDTSNDWRELSKEVLMAKLTDMLAASTLGGPAAALSTAPAPPIEAAGSSSAGGGPDPLILSYEAFEIALEVAVDEVGGLETLEGIRRIKGQREVEGVRTMYGAIREPLIRELAEVAQVTSADRFVDVGAGFNQVSLQLALTTGCLGAGIEVVGERSAVGVFLANAVKETLIKTGHVAPEDAQAMVDRSRCVQGDIRDHYAEIENSSVIYMNNVGDWLRDVHKRDSAGLTIHQAVCAIFARSAVGTRLIVLEKIPDLSGTWVQLQTVLAPPSWFSWRMGEKDVYIYTKRSNQWRCQKCQVDNDVLVGPCAFAPSSTCPVCASRPKLDRERRTKRPVMADGLLYYEHGRSEAFLEEGDY